jgi:streptomycin 6-kinase
VLSLPWPTSSEQPPELAAVRSLADAGIGPRRLWSDLDRGVLVMERVRPGKTMPTELPSLAEDARTTREVATLASTMAHEVDVTGCRQHLTTVREYSRALGEVDADASLWKTHRKDIERAIALRDALLGAPDHRDVFLHGDLHHYNVLEDARHGWRVIDPKGLIGPPEFEFGAFTYNPVGIQHHPHLEAITTQRVTIWSETVGAPWEAVRSWGYVAAVLSACWSGEDGCQDWRDAMTIALMLRDLSPC